MSKTNAEIIDMIAQLNNSTSEPITLLGIGPMSENVIHAAIELAKEKEFPVMLIASRNQIDSRLLGGGYVTCETQNGLRSVTQQIMNKVGYKGPIFLCRDHGGPWQRDAEYHQMIPEPIAMSLAKHSYLEDILAGFSLLHIDPTKDPHAPAPLPPAIVIRRVVELIEFIESERVERGLPPVRYEVGTDEISGWLTSPLEFESFIESLLQALTSKGLPKPTFIVGQTGTLVKMDTNLGTTNFSTAKALSETASKYGILFKEHNADYLSPECLRQHPGHKISASNVAPEFGLAETDALLQLAIIEKNAVIDFILPENRYSNFIDLLKMEVIKQRRWEKWLTPEMSARPVEQILGDEFMVLKIIRVCGHYSFTLDSIKNAKDQLFINIQDLQLGYTPQGFVVNKIKVAIMKYIDAFNLEKFSRKLDS